MSKSTKKISDELEERGIPLAAYGAAELTDELVAKKHREVVDNVRAIRERQAKEAAREERQRRIEADTARALEDTERRYGRWEPASPFDEDGALIGGPVWQLKQRKQEVEPDPTSPVLRRARNGRTRVLRGCLICGTPKVRPGTVQLTGLPAGYFGSVCRECDTAVDRWSAQVDKRLSLRRTLETTGSAEQLPSLDHVALAVSERLRAEMPDLDLGETDGGVAPGWEGYCWSWVLDASDNPEAVGPPDKPFAYVEGNAELSDYKRGDDEA